MIDTTKLMIGNFVRSKHEKDNYIEVAGLTNDAIFEPSESGEANIPVVYNMEEIEYIPVSRNWLRALGFESGGLVGEDGEGDYYLIVGEGLYLKGYELKLFGEGLASVGPARQIRDINVSFVHELQNVFNVIYGHRLTFSQ